MDMDDINEKGLSEYIVNGAYVRGLKIDHGVIIKSELWRNERLWILVQGDITISTSKVRKRIKAPYTELAPYGEPVTIFAHENTIMYAVTGTKTDELLNMREEQII